MYSIFGFSKNITTTVLSVLIFSFSLIAQSNGREPSDSSFVIDKIEISGNERTEEFVILRELTFAVGDTVNNEILFFNRERIFSLAIFTKVEIKVNRENNKNIVSILIEESWHIFPVPFLNIREKTLERTSYGISLKYKNFRGRNETIRANVSLGYDPFYSLQYENPLIIPSADISFYFTGSLGTPINKSPTLEDANGEEFDFLTIAFNTMWGKRINKENNLFLLGGYSSIEAPTKIVIPYMASGTVEDKTLSTGIIYTYDSRDLKQYANNGFRLQFDFLHNGLFNSKINYNSVDLDIRKYKELYKSLMVKGRFSVRHTFGEKVPYYYYSRLGFDYYTRGNRYLIREGNNRLLGSLELSYPILPEWNFAIDLPLLPLSLTRTRIAIHLGLFADAATVFNNGDRIKLNSFNSGYGIGLTFLFLPYSAFRIEYAFNEMGKGELLIETGISF